MVYGAFATLADPAAARIYVGWLVVLFGAVIAAYAPQPADAPGAAARRVCQRFTLAVALLARCAAPARCRRAWSHATQR